MLHDHDLVSVQEVRSKVEKAYAAWQTYRNYTQAQVDAVVEAIGAKGRAHARQLAEMAVQETGYGNVEDKVAKNLLNADLLIRYIRPMKTVGVLREIPEQKLIEIGVPVGVVAAILPTTNPTSTAIYKAAISLKAGNAVVLSPHPRAKASTCATAALLIEAAQEAGAPPDIIQCINNPSLEGTNALMRHPKTGVILSTGGSGIVRAAYSSGKPAFGVGPGNVPVLLDDSYDAGEGVRQVVAGKSFDYGTVCSSEQTLVASRARREEVLAALKKHGAYILDERQREAVERTLFSHGTTVRAECVGQSPQRIAELAGFSVPADVRILVAEIQGVGKEHPLSAEKLSPVLALLFTGGFEESVKACEGIVQFGGLGHTCVIFSNDEARIREFGLRIPAFRILVNTPSPQGSVGITTNLQPSMTLGCGAMGGNVTSDNVGPQHLINIKRIAWAVRRPEEAFDATAAPAAVPAKAPAAAVGRDAIVAAVEKYLAQRGVSVAGPAAPAPAPAPVRPPASLRGVVEGVVDRFLAARKPAAPVCGCQLPAQPAPAPAPQPAAEPPKPAALPAPAITIVDFVCESDVRSAIAQGRKIYIGPKTIVTPAAREAAGPDDDVLVRAER
jgi:acyl-CoA reductase-like NAD-dependent aldehyde dehydrogenase